MIITGVKLLLKFTVPITILYASDTVQVHIVFFDAEIKIIKGVIYWIWSEKEAITCVICELDKYMEALFYLYASIVYATCKDNLSYIQE